MKNISPNLRIQTQKLCAFFFFHLWIGVVLGLPTSFKQSPVQVLHLIFNKQTLHATAIINSSPELGFTAHILKISPSCFQRSVIQCTWMSQGTPRSTSSTFSMVIEYTTSNRDIQQNENTEHSQQLQ